MGRAACTCNADIAKGAKSTRCAIDTVAASAGWTGFIGSECRVELVRIVYFRLIVAGQKKNYFVGFKLIRQSVSLFTRINCSSLFSAPPFWTHFDILEQEEMALCVL